MPTYSFVLVDPRWQMVFFYSGNNILGDRIKMSNNNKNMHIVAEVGEESEMAFLPTDVTIAERATLTMDHIYSADLFARKSREIEKRYNEGAKQNTKDRQRYKQAAYVIGSIFAADAVPRSYD